MTFNINENLEELENLIQELKSFAVIHSMPMFITCAIENTNEGTVYKTDALSPAATNCVLTDNKFPNLINVMNGANTYYVSTETEMVLDAIRDLPSEVTSEYADLTDEEFDEDDFYSEE